MKLESTGIATILKATGGVLCTITVLGEKCSGNLRGRKLCSCSPYFLPIPVRRKIDGLNGIDRMRGI
jgi:hypothetical protein